MKRSRFTDQQSLILRVGRQNIPRTHKWKKVKFSHSNWSKKGGISTPRLYFCIGLSMEGGQVLMKIGGQVSVYIFTMEWPI
jgi:hypothetical protein